MATVEFGTPASLNGARLLARILTEQICREFNLLPISLTGGVATVAVADVDARLGVKIARNVLRHQIHVVLWPDARLAEALDVVFGVSEGRRTHSGGAESPPRMRIGEMLIELGLITDEQLRAALRLQRRTGSRLGEILVASGAVDELELLAVLSDHCSLQHVDLHGYIPDRELAASMPEPVVRTIRCVPLAADTSTLYVAVAEALSDEVLAMIAKYTQLEIRELLATRKSIDELLQRMYHDQSAEAARNDRRRLAPQDSNHRLLTLGQRLTLIVAGLAVVGGLVAAPGPSAIALVSIAALFYLCSSLYRAQLMYRSLRKGADINVTDQQIAAIDERELPIYTILVPLDGEAAMVPRLLAAIGRLDYPQGKLDVRLLCQQGDDQTIQAIRVLDPPSHFRLVIVPASGPRTKSQACNYGLLQADGDLVVIYGPGDRPEPDQLKKAVLAFAHSDRSVTCVQAKLNYSHTAENLLTRWSSIEYSMHFDLLLPGLCAVHAPIPLGGTSNHFRIDRLRELGAWDPYNVTEDLDLGVRLHKAGYATAMIDSTTLEEANSSVHNWIRQRSRWIKGSIQTWLLHMRNPVRLYRELGPSGFISFNNMTVGGAFVLLLNPILWALTMLFVATRAGFIQAVLPPPVFDVAFSTLLVGNLLFAYFNVAGSLQSRRPEPARYALMSPIYWGLMSWAAWKGFIQLLCRPFYREKTRHGCDEAALAASAHSPQWPPEFERRRVAGERRTADQQVPAGTERRTGGSDRRWANWDGAPVTRKEDH